MSGVINLLEKSFELYRKHFSLLAGYVAWLLLPFAALVLFSLPKENVFLTALLTLSSLAQTIIGLWLGVFIPLVVYDLLSKKTKVKLLELQNKAWGLLLSVIFVAIVEAVVFLGGLVLLIVPAFIFWIWFSMAQFAVMFDDKKGLEALAWSRELVRGRFWKSAWRIAAGPILFGFIVIIGTYLILFLLSFVFQTPISEIFSETTPLWVDVVSTIIETFSLPIFMIYFTLLYTELRQTKPKL
jgi:hypothetical protein